MNRLHRASEWAVVALVVGLVTVSLLLTATAIAEGAPPRRCFGKHHNGMPTDHEADFLVGRDGKDVFILKRGDDTATGLNGADRICGGRGADTLDGGPGFDRLRGGPGYDICRDGEIHRGCEQFSTSG